MHMLPGLCCRVQAAHGQPVNWEGAWGLQTWCTDGKMTKASQKKVKEECGVFMWVQQRVVCKRMQLQCVCVCDLQAVDEYYRVYQTHKMPEGSQPLSIDFVAIDGVVVVVCCWQCFVVAGEVTAEKVVAMHKTGHAKARLCNNCLCNACSLHCVAVVIACCQIKVWAAAASTAENKAMREQD